MFVTFFFLAVAILVFSELVSINSSIVAIVSSILLIFENIYIFILRIIEMNDEYKK